MTDMNGTQALLSGESTTADQEFIDLLVPPRRPRWKTALLIGVVLTLLIGSLAIATTGAIVPRLNASLASAEVNRDRIVIVVMKVHNSSEVGVEIDAVELDVPGLTRGRVATPLPLRIGANESAELTLLFDDFDCAGLHDTTNAHHLRMKARGLVPFTVTRDYDAETRTEGYQVSSDVAPETVEFADPNDGGWPRLALSGACKSASGVGE